MLFRRVRKRAAAVAVQASLLLFGVLTLFPVVYVLATSFKTKGGVLTRPPAVLPVQWSLEGYRAVLGSDMFRYYIPNTLFNSAASSLLTVFLAALAAYGFSRYRSRASRVLLTAVLALMMIPGLTNLVALYSIGSRLRLLGSRTLMTAVYTAGGLPFTIWILKAFFDAIPAEMEEAARMDGCGTLGTLFRVTLPLALPGLFAALLMMLVDTWNEFLAAVVLISRNQARTVTVGLYDFQSSFESAYHILSAACIVAMLPVVVLFLLGRRTFFRAMLEGALKG